MDLNWTQQTPSNTKRFKLQPECRGKLMKAACPSSLCTLCNVRPFLLSLWFEQTPLALAFRKVTGCWYKDVSAVWAIPKSSSKAQVSIPKRGSNVPTECIVSSLISNLLPPVKGDASKEQKHHSCRQHWRHISLIDGWHSCRFKMTTTTGNGSADEALN